MKFKITLIVIIILIILSIIVISASIEFKLLRKYLPLAIGETTYNMSLGVISVASYKVSGVPLNFGSNLVPASYDNPALNVTTSNILPVIIESTGNVDLKLEIMGAEYFQHSDFPLTYYFLIGNVTWNNTGNPTPIALNSSYVEVQPYLGLGNTRDIYLWVDIPPNQYSGLYNSTIFIQTSII